MMRTIIVLLLCLPIGSIAQEFEWKKPDSLFRFVQPVASLQLWSVYTMGEQAQLSDNGPLEPVQDRLNFMARRARFGFKGKPYQRLSYTLMVQYDNLGKDKLGAIRGSTNTGQLGILDAFVTWKISNNELAHVTMGYFHPQFSRECITGDMNVSSFDKSAAQGYIRNHINGKSYGRSTGLNLGGLKKFGLLTVGYNSGIFNNNTTSGDGLPETTGKFWSPIIVDRVTFSLGDGDQKTYAINYETNNFFNERKGITIGVNGARQGRTDIFSSNRSAGYDVMLNYRNLNIDYEEVFQQRTVEGDVIHAHTFQTKVGYNLILLKKFFLEPMVSYASFTGDPGGESTGREEMVDAGLNWYVNKKNLKVSLHYIHQNGNGDNGYTDEVTFKKGNFVGAGCVMAF